jgi:hypothetical protein
MLLGIIQSNEENASSMLCYKYAYKLVTASFTSFYQDSKLLDIVVQYV